VNALEQILEAIAARVRQVVREELAAHGPAATEMVTPQEYARDHSIAVSTVRQLIKDGRIEAINPGDRCHATGGRVTSITKSPPAPKINNERDDLTRPPATR
jgi:hypothetical protein